jgi:hypothetical protein
MGMRPLERIALVLAVMAGVFLAAAAIASCIVTMGHPSVKYAQFKNPTFGYITIVGRREDDLDRPYCDSVRVSEWVDVEFPPRKPEEQIPEQIAMLDLAEKDLRLKFEEKLHALAEQRTKLRSLTHQPEYFSGPEYSGKA